MEHSQFLHAWDVIYRHSSAYYAQSNGRAEAAYKNRKRILTTNVNASGTLDTDFVAKVLLLHCNPLFSYIGSSSTKFLLETIYQNQLVVCANKSFNIPGSRVEPNCRSIVMITNKVNYMTFRTCATSYNSTVKLANH